MNLRLHSRVVLWNLLIIAVLSPFLAFFLNFSQLALIIAMAVVVTLFFGNLVNILISRPLTQIAAASRRLASGDMQQRMPISGDEAIASLGNSLNTMAGHLNARMKELTDGKQRLEMIVGAMSEGVMVLDKSGRITLTNHALRDSLETGRDLSGKTPFEVVRRPQLENAVRNVLAGGPTEIVELVTDSGRILQANVAPVRNADGTVESCVAVFHDLTSIKRTERMRRD